MPVTSLWPSKPSHPSQPRPIRLLEEQANLLKEYNAALEGRVVSSYAEGKPTATVSLYILNPRLHGYNYRLLSFEQPLTGAYPITLVAHFKSKSVKVGKAEDDKQFLSLLTNVLGNTMTQNILDNLASMGDVMQQYAE